MRIKPLLISAALGVATPAIAGPLDRSMAATHWTACDGYGKPTENGDGMTKPASGLLGIFGGGPSAGNTYRTTPPSFGATGVAACDQALADSRLRPEFWGRKANLLAARAIHHLAQGSTDIAIRDLDAAQGLIRTPSDPFYQRSLGLSLKMVRAFALERQTRRPEALALAGEVLAARPWSRSTSGAMFALFSDERAMVNGEPIIVPLARLQPKVIDAVFTEAVRARDFDRAVRTYGNIAPPTRVPDIGVSSIEREAQQLRNEAIEDLFAISRKGAYAYSLAATGRPALALKALGEAEQSARSLTRPMPALAAGQKEGRRDQLRRQLNAIVVKAGEETATELSSWRAMTELRIALSDGSYVAAPLPKLLPNGAAMDLLLALDGRKHPEAGPLIAALEQFLTEKPMPLDEQVKLLFGSLPHAEIAERIAAYRKANSPFVAIMIGGATGFKTKANRDGTTTVSFTGEKSSGSVVEELALLRAAEFSREQGKTGFVIKNRADYERSLTTYTYGVAGATQPDGFSTELTIEPVDLANLPEPYRSAPWRVIPVASVVEQLGATYYPQRS